VSRALAGLVLAALLAVPVPSFAQAETIGEIRVHGNHATPDAEILGLSGLEPGAPAGDDRLQAAEQALRASGRFEGAQVLKRFRSIDDASDILVMILVEERPSVTPEDLTPGPLKRLRASQQWLPILGYADGYGLTYGARTSFNRAAGPRSRLSVPLSWGGERRGAVEVGRSFDRGPLSSARAAVGVSRRVNPHYEQADLRTGLRLGADRRVSGWLRAGADGRVERVAFGGLDGVRHTAVGVHLTADTRIDPSFPRNAVFARIGWERVGFATGAAARIGLDARGYVGVIGSTVLALRAQASRADAPLPAVEQPLLGGSATLRGYRAGHRAGDSLAALSAELRVPLNSPLSAGRFGVKGFVDAGTVWSAGTRLADQPWDRGIGAGVYLGAAVFMLDVDVAWPEEGSARAHVSLGVTF
jgi:outer membrane protein assembly factor BamA